MRLILILTIVLFLSINSSYSQKQKIILDTDIGSDIDDAFALALVLASDEFEGIGITTGEGFTVMDDGKGPNCEIAMYINKDEFLRKIMRRYLRQNLRRE